MALIDEHRSKEDLIQELKQLRKQNSDLVGTIQILTENNERLNTLMDLNPSLIFLKDESGRYVYLNKTYETQFVGTPDWYGKTDFDFWAEESAQLFRANDLAVLETGQVIQYLEDSKDLDGKRYCWLNYKFPYTDAKNRRYSGGIGIDVTKRILTEEALQKAGEELQRYADELKRKEEETLELVDSFAEGSWIVDCVAGTIKCSEKWAKRIGLDLVPEEERLPYVRTLSHPEDTAGGNSIHYYMDTGATWFDLEYRIKTKDSGYIWTQNRGKVVNNEHGKAIKVYAATFDITQRKRMEEELKKSNQQLEELVNERTRKLEESRTRITDILESISDGFVAFDENLCYTYVNRRAAELLGHLPKDIIGRPLKELIPKPNKLALEIYCQVLREKIPRHFEVYSEQLKKWTEIEVYPFSRGISVYFKDITERKRMEQQVVDALEFNQAIVSAAPFGIHTFDSSGSMTFANDAAAKTSGGSKEVLIEKINFNQLESWKLAGLQNVANEVLATGISARSEAYMKTYFGKDVWLDVNFSRFFAGGEAHLLGMYADITERKQAEEALRLSEERFSIAFRSSPVLMAIASQTDNRYVDVNDSWLGAFGLTREQVIGRTPYELNIFCNPEDLAEKGLELKKNKKLYGYELLFWNAEGETRVGLASSETIGLQGEDCYLHTIIDITQQRQIEKEMSRFDRLNLIGEMAASIGHEIRNPMTSIRGFLQMLNSKECYQEDRTFFELMIEELDRANDIISEYLGMAKDKRVDLQAQYLDEVVKSLYPMIQADANYQEMDVRLNLGKPPMPLIDANEIRQLILNIARNGLEAMSPGGILTIGTTSSETEIVLFVKDQGPGLAPELIDKLGTPFLTTKDKGTGLGLAVCYSIAARHNARIDYETGADGTTFYIRFPMPMELTLF